jgi:hypothetical protein
MHLRLPFFAFKTKIIIAIQRKKVDMLISSWPLFIEIVYVSWSDFSFLQFFHDVFSSWQKTTLRLNRTHFIYTHKSIITIEHNFLFYPNVFFTNIELNSSLTRGHCWSTFFLGLTCWMNTFLPSLMHTKYLPHTLLWDLLFKWHFLILNSIFSHNCYRNHMQNVRIWRSCPLGTCSEVGPWWGSYITKKYCVIY